MNRWLRSKSSEQGRLALLWSLLLLLLLSACGSSSNNIFEQPLNSSENNSTHQPLSTQNISRMHPLWTYTFASDAPYKMVVVNGIAYVLVAQGSGYSLIAVQNGKQLWRYQPPDHKQYIADVQVGGGIVFLAATVTTSNANNTIYAINERTGQELWHYPTETPIYHLVYGNGLLYFSTQVDVLALDAQAGKLQWSYRFSDGSNYAPYSPSLAATGGSLYISLSTSPYRTGMALVSLDGRTGKVQWQQSEMGDMTTSLVVDNGVVYRRVHYRSSVNQSSASQLLAFNAQTGKELWNTSIASPGYDNTNDMRIDHNLLYMSASGQVQAFAINTGHLIWSTAVEGLNVSSGPIVGNGVVYVSTETPAPAQFSLFTLPPRAKEWLYALDAQSGKLLRTLQESDSTFKAEGLQLDNGRLYVCGERGFIGSDDAANGQPNLYALGV